MKKGRGDRVVAPQRECGCPLLPRLLRLLHLVAPLSKGAVGRGKFVGRILGRADVLLGVALDGRERAARADISTTAVAADAVEFLVLEHLDRLFGGQVVLLQ